MHCFISAAERLVPIRAVCVVSVWASDHHTPPAWRFTINSIRHFTAGAGHGLPRKATFVWKRGCRSKEGRDISVKFSVFWMALWGYWGCNSAAELSTYYRTHQSDLKCRQQRIHAPYIRGLKPLLPAMHHSERFTSLRLVNMPAAGQCSDLRMSGSLQQY